MGWGGGGDEGSCAHGNKERALNDQEDMEHQALVIPQKLEGFLDFIVF
jgi:hypothetical protein